MTLKIYRKKNDRLPDVVLQLSGPDGSPLTLPVGTTATFKLVDPTGAVVHATATALVDVDLGRLTYELQGGDLSVTGVFLGEFLMSVAPLGKPQHVPKIGSVQILVSPSL